MALDSLWGRRIAGLAAAAMLATSLFAAASAGGDDRGASPSAATATVKIREFDFHPGTLTVQRGTKVVFSNRDSVTHTAKRAGSFATGRIAPGKAASVRFNSSGTYAYHCTIHKFMRGKVVVP
jgi:plastocyanin